MPVARRGIQQVLAETTSAPVASLSCAFPGDTTAGDLVVAGIATNNQAAGPVVGGFVDDQGNTYGRDAVGLGLNTTDDDYVGIYSQSNIGGGPLTATYTPLTNATMVVILSEYSGVAPGSPLDVTAAGGSDTPSNAQSSGVTAPPNHIPGVAVAMIAMHYGTDPPNPPSPFIVVRSISSVGSSGTSTAVVDRVISVAEAQECVWAAPSVTWDACIAVYTAQQPISGETRGLLLGESDIAGRYPDDLEA